MTIMPMRMSRARVDICASDSGTGHNLQFDRARPQGERRARGMVRPRCRMRERPAPQVRSQE